MTEEYKLIVGDEFTTKKDSLSIIDKLCKENPNMTIKEYLEKYHKIVILN